MKDEVLKVTKKDIAKNQLDTAVFLFLHKISYASSITLAGAAGNILFQLVLNEGKVPFADFGREIANTKEGVLLPRKSYKYRLEILLGVIPLKHMNENCDEDVVLDLEDCAVNTLTYAIHDYITLYGQEEPFIKAFLSWVWNNKNGPQIMNDYRDSIEKIKK